MRAGGRGKSKTSSRPSTGLSCVPRGTTRVRQSCSRPRHAWVELAMPTERRYGPRVYRRQEVVNDGSGDNPRSGRTSRLLKTLVEELGSIRWARFPRPPSPRSRTGCGASGNAQCRRQPSQHPAQRSGVARSGSDVARGERVSRRPRMGWTQREEDPLAVEPRSAQMSIRSAATAIVRRRRRPPSASNSTVQREFDAPAMQRRSCIARRRADRRGGETSEHGADRGRGCAVPELKHSLGDCR